MSCYVAMHKQVQQPLAYPTIRYFESIQTRYRTWVCRSSPYDDRQKRPPVFYHDLAITLGHSHTGDYLMLSEDESKHARVVLRLRDGDLVELCDGHGTVVSGRVAISDVGSQETQEGQASTKKSSRGRRKRSRVGVLVETEPTHHAQPHPRWLVAVACGSLKGGRGDWLIEKVAEIGAAGFIPLMTERSPKIDGSGREERWERLSISVMKQSLQPYKMVLHSPCSVENLVSGYIDQNTMVCVGVEDAQPLHPCWASVMSSHQFDTGLIVIGPEGDFTEKEIHLLEEHGAHPVGLGNKRLRTETAAIAMLSYLTVASAM